jgi:CRP-like cAMP-binding protein
MIEEGKIWHLREINILDGLSDQTLRRLAERTEMIHLQKRQTIYFPETQTRGIYFLKMGHVKIVRLSEEGREAILDVVGPGELFGELCLVDDDQDDYVEIAQALDDVVLCSMTKEGFVEFLNENPSLNLRMLKLIGLKLRKVESKLEDLVFKDARERVIEFVLRFAESYGRIRNRKITVSKFLSQEEIAHLTGTSRQTVAAILNELRREGTIHFTNRELTILQPSKLSSSRHFLDHGGLF